MSAEEWDFPNGLVRLICGMPGCTEKTRWVEMGGVPATTLTRLAIDLEWYYDPNRIIARCSKDKGTSVTKPR